MCFDSNSFISSSVYGAGFIILPIKTKRKDGYYKDLTDLRDKILPLINLSILEISNNLNITKRRVNWCIKKYKLKWLKIKQDRIFQ